MNIATHGVSYEVLDFEATCDISMALTMYENYVLNQLSATSLFHQYMAVC
tara:strand:- start:3648 stop:3797 length:150 start_codon:yes stop_codon:yes gene_type:complete